MVVIYTTVGKFRVMKGWHNIKSSDEFCLVKFEIITFCSFHSIIGDIRINNEPSWCSMTWSMGQHPSSDICIQHEVIWWNQMDENDENRQNHLLKVPRTSCWPSLPGWSLGPTSPAGKALLGTCHGNGCCKNSEYEWVASNRIKRCGSKSVNIHYL
jgi:hypothetical protein